MKVTFIGHGLKGGKGTVADYICSSLKNQSYDSFTVFSAFTKMSGINIFKKELLKAKESYKSIKFYLGIVEKGTSKEVLDFLIENKIETWIFCTSSSIMFHPKIYFFQGENNARFISGSSNLTKPGLISNIEASTLLEFNPKNNQSQKFLNQFNEYFESILNGTDNNTEKLNKEVLNDLIDAGYIYDEKNTNDDFENLKRNSLLFKKRKKTKLNTEELGKIKEEQHNSYDYKYEDKITDYYLEHWELLFKEYRNYIKNTGSKNVSKNYENPRLYTWYRKQKIFYAKNIIPKEHFDKLVEIGFYFGDSRKLKWQIIDEEWLDILTDALIDKENIKISNHYFYKGKKLGAWLVRIVSKNKIGKKLEIGELIEELGFALSKRINIPNNTARRFIKELSNDNSPKKMTYQSRFNRALRDSKDDISEEMRLEVEKIWRLKFNEDRPWGKIRERTNDRTPEWKNFRYNSSINPEKKWFATVRQMGNLYNWARQKREIKSRMDLIKDNFNDKEKDELRKEGFPI